MARPLCSLLCFLLGCGTMFTVSRLTDTTTMSIDHAVGLLSADLTAQQRNLVAAALRRQVLAAIRALKDLATAPDHASGEAIGALEQIREAVR